MCVYMYVQVLRGGRVVSQSIALFSFKENNRSLSTLNEKVLRGKEKEQDSQFSFHFCHLFCQDRPCLSSPILERRSHV